MSDTLDGLLHLVKGLDPTEVHASVLPVETINLALVHELLDASLDLLENVAHMAAEQAEDRDRVDADTCARPAACPIPDVLAGKSGERLA